MEGMFDTIAYCLGFSSNGVTPIEEKTPTFKTKEAEDQWTLVDIDCPDSEGKSEVNDFPRPLTPPPSPKLEQSWLLAPPPCFNAEENEPMGELSARENLLIEHPSMFVCPHLADEQEETPAIEEPNTPVVRHRGAPQSLRRSQRRAARQATSAICQHNRRNSQFKKTNCDIARRNNKSFQKMRQLVQQPRKRC